MDVITGIFDSSQKAAEVADYLRHHGFKGEISVVGRHNEEAFREAENVRGNTDDVTGMAKYGVTGGLVGASIGLTAFMIPGIGPLVAAGPIAGLIGGALGGELIGVLTRFGVPEKEGEELKSIIESGKSVIMIKCEGNEKSSIVETLEQKGAENIRS